MLAVQRGESADSMYIKQGVDCSLPNFWNINQKHNQEHCGFKSILEPRITKIISEPTTIPRVLEATKWLRAFWDQQHNQEHFKLTTWPRVLWNQKHDQNHWGTFLGHSSQGYTLWVMPLSVYGTCSWGQARFSGMGGLERPCSIPSMGDQEKPRDVEHHIGEQVRDAGFQASQSYWDE